MLAPQPPVDMLIDKGPEMVITAALAGITALAFLYALYQWAKTKRPMVLVLLVTGGAMLVMEPMVDLVGGCWFPANSWVAFVAYGRPIPVWLCLAYFFYFGIASALVWMALRKGMSQRQLVWAFCTAMLGDIVFEQILLTVDPYTYYGNQPLMLGKFPMWWAATNGLIPFVLGVVIYKLDFLFKGWRHLYIIPIGLMTSAATNAAVGWPSWLVINSDFGPAATQAGGLITFVLAFWILHGLGRIAAAKSAPDSAISTLHPSNA